MERGTTDRKTWPIVDLKLDAEGEGTFVAAFATFEVWDAQDDWTERGAIGNQKVVISQWNHGSWDSGVAGLPVGVGEIHEDGKRAIVKGEFNLGSPDGIATYQTIKYLVGKGRNVEWSYALPEVEWAMGEREGRRGRIIQKVKVPEVSPVLLAAGVDTAVLSIKDGGTVTKPTMTGTLTAKEIKAALMTLPESTKQIPSKRLVDHIDEAVQSVTSVARRAAVVRALRFKEGKKLSRAACEKLTALRASLHDAGVGLDQLLMEPETPPEHDVSRELRNIQAAVEERRRAYQTTCREAQ